MSQDAEFVFELVKYVQNIDACDSDGKAVSFSIIKYQSFSYINY